jgi:NAD(P)-dependent dehydrogenase (short-subunit alcohol dehydrogenase family)
VNLLGVWRTIRASLPHVLSARGYLLAVSSLAGHVQGPLQASYNASKAAIEALAKTLRLEVQDRGVDVGVAHLGYTDTERGRWAVEHPAINQLPGLRIPRPLPTSRTAATVVRAIERRSRRVVVPRWAAVALLAPGLLQRRLEAVARRHGWAAIIGQKDRR